MSKCAWVTLTTNDAYSLGAMVLAHSLKRVGTVHELVVMITPTVSEAMRSRLREVFNVVQEVNVLDSKDATNLAILARPELGITFTKLHCWKLVQYQKCVFLDSDTLVIQNCDELMEREELSAAPEVCWPDCFNSGVFVYRPSEATFNSIIEFAAKHGSFDGGDQGILNSYFSQWAHTDITKHLPYTYNTAAFAVYSYLPAFKEFKNKIKILHFAGKVKPWLLNFNSETKQASIPPMFTHAGDFIQLWWNIFCDNVHKSLSDKMENWPIEEFENNVPTWTQNINNPNMPSSSPSVSNYDSGNFFDDIQPYHDPWEDYYENLENLKEQNFYKSPSSSPTPPPPPQICLTEQQQQEQHQDTNSNYVQENIPQIQSEPEEQIASHSHHNPFQSNHTSPPQVEDFSHHQTEMQQNWAQANDNQVEEMVENHNWQDDHSNNWCQTTIPSDDSTDTHHTLSENELNQTLNEALLNEQQNQIEFNLDSSAITVSSESSESSDDYEDAMQNGTNRNHIENEAGLAGALAQVRLGEPRSSEQEAYEASMRRQCWEAGNIDYTGRDSFDNIWKKIQETLEMKTDAPAKDGQLTSAEIQDGKVEYDPVTKARTVYKHIEGGYEVHTTIPQQNGTVKTQVKTFYDPKPVTEEEMLKQQQEKKKRTKKSANQVVQIDKNTTMITREVPGGYEEVYTTVYDDGSKSMRTKTFYDAVEQEIVDEDNTKVQQKKKPSSKLTRHDAEEEEKNVKKTTNKQLVQANQRNVHQVDEDSNEEYNAKHHHSTVEETHHVSKKTETSNKKTVVRKESVQEENTKSVTSSSKDKKKKSKKAPPPPADFPQNETTTVTSNKVSGGHEYTYSTVLENGKTVTTSKTIYEEEDVELTEEEIQIYKKQLKDAEKHKNVTTTKKLKSESGTKKIVPSENPGEVTTVETIKIEGGTEYRYTTVTAEGIVKKAIKTVYDPVPKENPDDSEEEEIIEDYEEEIIEPGEKVFKTIESIKTLPQRFDEIVEVNTPKKKSTKLSRTDTQEEESRIIEKKNNAMTSINQQQSNVRKMEQEEHTTGNYNVRRESKVEETRSMTQKIKISGKY